MKAVGIEVQGSEAERNRHLRTMSYRRRWAHLAFIQRGIVFISLIDEPGHVRDRSTSECTVGERRFPKRESVPFPHPTCFFERQEAFPSCPCDVRAVILRWNQARVLSRPACRSGIRVTSVIGVQPDETIVTPFVCDPSTCSRSLRITRQRGAKIRAPAAA